MIPQAAAADIIPIIIPSTRKGPLMNQFVAPTYFIIEISRALAKTVSLIIFETTMTEIRIRNTIIAIFE